MRVFLPQIRCFGLPSAHHETTVGSSKNFSMPTERAAKIRIDTFLADKPIVRFPKEDSEKPQRKLCGFLAVKTAIGGIRCRINTGVGRSDRTRTCGIEVPNAKNMIFYVILRAFRGFLVRIDCFRVLFAA